MKKYNSWDDIYLLKANPKTLKKKIECDACGKKFTVTEKQNVKEKKVLIKIKEEYGDYHGFLVLFDKRQWRREIYEQGINVHPICPNCECEHEELFTKPTGVIIKGEWWSAGSVNF